MSDQERVMALHPDAVCVRLDVFGSIDYMIRTSERELTGWCRTEARAWQLASELLPQTDEVTR